MLTVGCATLSTWDVPRLRQRIAPALTFTRRYHARPYTLATLPTEIGARVEPISAATGLDAYTLARHGERVILVSECMGDELLYTLAVLHECSHQITGRPWPSNTLWHNLQRALTAAGISRIRPHDLRHSAATFMIVRRRPLPVVAEILGHRSAAFTASRYAHVIASQHQEVADVMGDLLTDPEGQSGAKTG